jgi:TonB family protein
MKKMLLFSALAHLAIIGVITGSSQLSPQKVTNSAVYMVRIVESIPNIKEAKASKPVQINSTRAKESKISKKRELTLQAARRKLAKREKLETLRERIASARKAESRGLAAERRKLQAWKEKMDGGRKALEIATQSEVSQASSAWQLPSWYIDLIYNRAFESWHPLPNAIEKETCILFEIYRDGRIGSLAIEKISGDSSFDQSAFLAVKELNPLPPLPGQFKENYLRVHLTFRQGN